MTQRRIGDMQIRVHNIQVNTKMMVSYHKNMDIEG